MERIQPHILDASNAPTIPTAALRGRYRRLGGFSCYFVTAHSDSPVQDHLVFYPVDQIPLYSLLEELLLLKPTVKSDNGFVHLNRGSRKAKSEVK